MRQKWSILLLIYVTKWATLHLVQEAKLPMLYSWFTQQMGLFYIISCDEITYFTFSSCGVIIYLIFVYNWKYASSQRKYTKLGYFTKTKNDMWFYIFFAYVSLGLLFGFGDSIGRLLSSHWENICPARLLRDTLSSMYVANSSELGMFLWCHGVPI
jgi:hypothetical protein